MTTFQRMTPGERFSWIVKLIRGFLKHLHVKGIQEEYITFLMGMLSRKGKSRPRGFLRFNQDERNIKPFLVKLNGKRDTIVGT